MVRKTIVVLLAALAALFAVPAAAQAAGYTGQGSDVTLAVGEVGTMTFSDLPPNTPSTATADDAVTLATLRAATASKPTDASGTVSYDVSSNTPGTYTITVTAGQSVATGTLTVVPADSSSSGDSSGLPSTGYDFPTVLLWVGIGALVLGAAVVVILRAVRRGRTQE